MKSVLWLIITALYVAAVGLASLIPQMGDCFPATNHVCSTDVDRNHRSLMIWIIGILIYFLLARFLLRRKNPR